MKIIKEHMLHNILSYTILYILIITSLHIILSLNGLMFRNCIVYISSIVIVIGLITGIIQLALKIKKKATKYIVIVIFIFILLKIGPYIYFVLRVGLYHPEYVVKVDGNKYIAHDEGFWNTNILYYDYINIFVSGNQARMEKDGKGNFDPINNKLDYEFEYK